jgi:hypothetical protein
LADLIFPASVMVIKFLFKLFIDQRVGLVETTKSLLAFPVDIVFLSFSFGSALLYAMPIPSNSPSIVKSSLILALACLCVAILTIVACKKSDAAMISGKWSICVLFFVSSYILSAFTVFGAIQVRSFVQ